MATAVSGRRGRFQIAGTNYYVEQWSVSDQTDIIETTSFEDQNAVTGRTARTLIDGVDQATISVKGYFDADIAAASGFATGGVFCPGTDVTNVKLFVNKSIGNNCWTFTTAKVARVNSQGQVRGRFEFDLTLESNGTYTRPTA